MNESSKPERDEREPTSEGGQAPEGYAAPAIEELDTTHSPAETAAGIIHSYYEHTY